MKSFLILTVLGLFMLSASGQEEKPKIYNPQADTKKELAQAINEAKSHDKHVLVQVGGNW